MNKAVWLLGALIAASGILFLYQDHRIKTDAAQRALLIVGTSAEYQPFTFIQDDRIIGFEIEIAQEIVNRLDKNIQLYDMPFDTLIPEAQLGNIQLIAAGLTPTPERAEQLLFTEPYLINDPLVVITKKPFSIQSLKDLVGKRVVVNEGYTADFYMTKQENIILRRMTTPANAMAALEHEAVDAFVTARNCAKHCTNHNGIYKFNMFTIPSTNESYSLAIAKKHAKLLPDISKALNGLKQDGTLQKLKQKWHIAGTIKEVNSSSVS